MPRKMARQPRSSASDTNVSSALLPESVPQPPSKISLVLDLLQREEGASLAELVALTGWLPHTTRAALSGLRKKGHAIARDNAKSETRYVIRGYA